MGFWRGEESPIPLVHGGMLITPKGELKPLAQGIGAASGPAATPETLAHRHHRSRHRPELRLRRGSRRV